MIFLLLFVINENLSNYKKMDNMLDNVKPWFYGFMLLYELKNQNLITLDK